MNKFSWLHISDFHLRVGDPYDRNVVLNSLVCWVAENRQQGRKPDLIFATGDIAHSGKASEYEHATAFFDELVGAADLERRHLYIVPGNHDADRDRGVGLARKLTSREEADTYFGPDIPKPHLTQKLGAFRKWYNEYFKGIRELPDDTTCGPVEVAEIRGLHIAILPLNTAIFCQDDNDHNKLIIGRRCLKSATDELGRLEKVDLKIALMHHPIDWLADVERGNIKATLQEMVDVLLRGHLHETDVESVVSPSGGALHLAAGASYQTRKWPNRALYSSFEDGGVEIFPIRFEDSPTEIWTVDPSVFPREPGYVKAFPIPRLNKSQEAQRPTVDDRPATLTEVPRFRSNILSRGDLPFVERDQLLKDIELALGDPTKERVLVLHGPPGVGKSELAREFARRHRPHYPGGTFLVRTGSAGAELVDLAHIGANVLGLQFPSDLSLQDQCERTLLSLGVAPVLMIYDNAVNLESISPWLPRSGMPCHVLITTLNERLSPQWPAISVPPFSPKASLELITQVAGREVAERHGRTLVKLSGGLPIQLVPASIMLAYEARRGRLDRTVLSIGSETRRSFQSVYDTLDSSVHLLLHAAAFLNCERIVCRELSLHMEEACDWSSVEFERHLDVCLDFHLLEGADELRMHQLFESFLMGVEIREELKTKLDQVRAVQRDRFVELGQGVVDKPADRELVSALLTYSLEPQKWDQAYMSLSIDDGEAVGRGLIQIGRFEEARPWYERAVAEKERGDVNGEVDHKDLGISLHHVGYCLSRVGKFAQAQPWFERAVAEKEHSSLQGRINHDSLGRSLHLVGFCLSNLKKFEEALPWYERAVAEKELGDIDGMVDHESFSKSLHHVGICLSSVDKFDEARLWFERSVEEGEQGDAEGRVDHDSVGRAVHQVGICLSRMHKFEEALPWYERAVAEKEQGDVYGRVDHDNLGRSLSEVGFCLLSVDKFDEALGWYERAVTEAEQGDVHGRVDHDDMGRAVHQVGICLSRMHKFKEALPWYERAVIETEKGNVHGQVDQQSVILSLSSVAYCLREMGRPKEAQKWADRASKYR